MRKIATSGLPIAAALAVARYASNGNSEGQSDEREKEKAGNPSSPVIERVALYGSEALRDFGRGGERAGGPPAVRPHHPQAPAAVLPV